MDSGNPLYPLHETERSDLRRKKEDPLDELQQADEKTSSAGSHRRWIHNFSNPAIAVLSDDVLISIFEELQRVNRTTGIIIKPNPEITLTHICRRWRHLAIRTPLLWARLMLYWSPGQPALDQQGFLNELRTYLDRVQDHPMELWVGPTRQSWEAGAQRDVLEFITPHLRRFRTLQLPSDHLLPTEDFARKLEYASLPMLKSLTISPAAYGEDEDADYPPLTHWEDNILLGGTVSLKYLHLDPLCIRDYRPPLSTLVHLRIEDASGVSQQYVMSLAVIETFFSLPCLESLSIWGPAFLMAEGEEMSDRRTVTSKRLKHCRLDATHSLKLEYLLAHVIAPALETLTAIVVPGLVYGARDLEPFPSLHTLSLCVEPIMGPVDSTLTSFLNFVSLTSRIKRLVLTLPSSRADILSWDSVQEIASAVTLPNMIAQTWSQAIEVTVNTSPLNPTMPFHLFIPLFPNVKTIRVRKESLGLMLTDRHWNDFQARFGFDVVEIPEDEILIPFHWSPGPNWLGIASDPFVHEFDKTWHYDD